ncbi:MAG: hypothetical protein JKY90_05465 [Gammaproteobacteria bacterium]|nr:hypothetical protein [Gammaproteobacteria bacterium]
MLWACLILSPQVIAYDGENELGLVVQAASDWVYDGTTETRGEPSIGINGEWRLQSSVFLGFEAHEARVVVEQQRQRSVALYAGVDHLLSKDWYSALSLQHRAFPGSVAEWDFTEIVLQFAYRDNWSFSFDYSPDYYERDTEAFGTELSYTNNISSRSYWSIQAGTQQLSESQLVDYHYARLGLGISTAALNFDLSYGWNSEDGTLLFGSEPILSPELVLQLNYRLK